MKKLDGKFSADLGSDIAKILNNNIACTVSSDGYDLYVSRELTAEETRLINDLKCIEKFYPEYIYEGLRIASEVDIEKDTKDHTKMYSPYNIGNKSILYHVPKGKRLVKESQQ